MKVETLSLWTVGYVRV